jgi:hypothetical protein
MLVQYICKMTSEKRPILDRVGKMIKEICTSDDPSRAVTILENVIADVSLQVCRVELFD